MSLNRREFIKVMAVAGMSPWTPRLGWAQEPTARQNRALVCLFLRGGADAVNLLAPYADPLYRQLRPTLALPEPGVAGGVLPLDSQLGLPPTLEPLLPLYRSGDLALVSLCGLGNDSRSHFDRQRWMEAGGDGIPVPGDGWLARALAQTDLPTPVAAVGFGGRLPFALSGASAVAIRDLDRFGLPAKHMSALTQLYEGGNLVSQAGQQTLAALNFIGNASLPPQGSDYPDSSLGRDLAQTARLIKSGIGLRAFCLDSGGWDTHANQAATLAARLDDLARSLAAFHADLGAQMTNTCVVVMSEFGRRVAENASGGTDHGHGGVMLVLGGGVQGGKIYGDRPDLSDLYGPGDLPVTTDYRSVLAEAVTVTLGVSDLKTVFPGFQPQVLGLF
ncbi:hypothetical protein MIT9_P0191 [Methylomarinovum caldicuralii]|uniref:DUF1501 domain-containing protein n=1 Tax=Methylomarinovum caldicuralii TaxID=438856 RepID=A0AAU9CRU7_9GAMM|nr:DUF1501 domain-containing protein [Methylomarinovum caldicuralii]BCX80617.1 hypothetical protein MIT9_P0191 [Methylomarinovum caldicuralii]